MKNSSEKKNSEHGFSQTLTAVLGVVCILIIGLSLGCVTPAKNIKSSEPVNPKNTQQPLHSQAQTDPQRNNTQGISSGELPNSSSGRESVNHEDTGSKKRTTSAQKSIDSFLGNLSLEERTVLSWLIGGVLGLAFIMLIIKGIISKHK